MKELKSPEVTWDPIEEIERLRGVWGARMYDLRAQKVHGTQIGAPNVRCCESEEQMSVLLEIRYTTDRSTRKPCHLFHFDRRQLSIKVPPPT